MKLTVISLILVALAVTTTADCVFSSPHDSTSFMSQSAITCNTPYRIRWIDMLPKGIGVTAQLYEAFPDKFVRTLFAGDLTTLNQSQYETFECSLGPFPPTNTFFQIIMTELPNTTSSYTCRTKIFRLSTCGNGVLDLAFGEECDVLLESNCILPLCTCNAQTYNVPGYGLCCGVSCNVTGDVIFDEGVNLSGRKLTVVGDFSLGTDPVILDPSSEVTVGCLNLSNSQLIFNASTVSGNETVTPLTFKGCVPDITKINVTGLDNCTVYNASYVPQSDGSSKLQLVFSGAASCAITMPLSETQKIAGIVMGIIASLTAITVIIFSASKNLRRKAFPWRKKPPTPIDDDDEEDSE